MNKRIIILSGLFILFVVTGLLLIKSVSVKNPAPSQNKTVNLKPVLEPFPPNANVAKVGGETLYGKDLNYLTNIYYSGDFASSSANVDEAKKMVIDQAVKESVTLQLGRELNLVTLTPEIFNSTNKNLDLRNEKIREITNELKNREEKLSGEAVSIWFHNVDLPQIPIAQAQTIALNKITGIHNRLVNNSITMKQAAQEIFNDSSLAKIDKNYKGNAYYEFKDVSPSELNMTFPELNMSVLSLNEGDISPVIRVPREGTRSIEEFFAIIKMNRRINPGAGSVVQILRKGMEKYGVTQY